MSIGRSAPWLALGLVLGLASCDSSSGTSSITVTSALQDLTVDPDGATTVVTFSVDPGLVSAGNFQADGGQTALSALSTGGSVVVTWDAIVSPADRIQVVAVNRVPATWVPVTTSDPSAPTFAVASATQVPGLGADTITVQFSGPRVVEAEAEDLANWSIEVNGTALDLTGSTFDLSPATQVLSVTTGAGANLHASFDLIALDVHSVAATQLATTPVTGAATGDTTAPSLVSVVQNLAEDEFGRTVDVTFDEAMDPTFSTSLANFIMAAPDVSVLVEQPSPELLRVTFTGPVVPGGDRISLQNLVDAHGNSFPTQLANVTAGSTVANAFAGTPAATTVPNVGGDFIVASFVQAVDPDSGEDWTTWELESPLGAGIDLSAAMLDMDLLSKTLTISNLPVDFVNGDDFLLMAAPGNEPLDVDGELFTDSFTGTAGGETGAPAVSGQVQNRTFDPSGTTVDVTLSEDVDQTSAEMAGNWGVSGVNVTLAELQPNLRVVRLTLDAAAIPGTQTLSASGVADLAGNLLVPVGLLAISSTDLIAPSATSAVASAVEGANDDTLFVSFDDDMIQAEVELGASWVVESPVGTPLDASTSSVSYDPASRTATLTFDGGGIHLKRDDDFSVRFTAMRDLGANGITSDVLTGSVVAEMNLPRIDAVWVETAFSNEVHVRFSEPCDHLDDILGWTVYTVRDSGGVVKGTPVSATVHADEMGAELVFAFAVVAGADTLDVSGITDLAGNWMFPVQTWSIEAEDAGPPALDGTASGLTVSGEANDVITAVFDRRPSVWGLLEPTPWTLVQGGTPVNLSGATFSFDGNLTVTIDLDSAGSPSLRTGLGYDLTVDGLLSAQGVAMTAPSIDGFTALGDAQSPSLPAGLARLDAASSADTLLIEMDEAIDPADAANTALIDINGAINPDTAEAAGRRTVRAFFSGGVSTADTVNVSLRDLAGIVGVASRVVASPDLSGPLVVSVTGTAVPDAGGDTVTIRFDKPVDLASAFSTGNYTVTNGASAIDLAGSVPTWDSTSNTVTIRLSASQHLSPASGIIVTVDNVADHAGLLISPPANIGGAVGGDVTPPDFSAAFANYRADAGGLAVDVLFDEDVDAAFAGEPLNWTASGGQTAMAVQSLSGKIFRVMLDTPLGAGDTLDLVGLPDLAGNVSGAISVPPLL